MTAYDDLTDSSPETPADALADQPGGAAQTPGEIGGDDQTVNLSGDPGGDTDLGTMEDDLTGQGPGVGESDADRGNLDGSTPVESSREDALDDASEAVRDPSGAAPEEADVPGYTDAGDSGQDNGRSE
jgi:hypothetical protein